MSERQKRALLQYVDDDLNEQLRKLVKSLSGQTVRAKLFKRPMREIYEQPEDRMRPIRPDLYDSYMKEIRALMDLRTVESNLQSVEGKVDAMAGDLAKIMQLLQPQ